MILVSFVLGVRSLGALAKSTCPQLGVVRRVGTQGWSKGSELRPASPHLGKLLVVHDELADALRTCARGFAVVHRLPLLQLLLIEAHVHAHLRVRIL